MLWIKKIRAPKFYRYWYYRQYKFAQSIWSDDPELSAMTISAMTMVSQAIGLLHIITLFLDENLQSQILSDNGAIEWLAFTFLFLGISYMLLYRNEKWKVIVDEFKNESDRQRK